MSEDVHGLKFLADNTVKWLKCK